MKTNLPFSLTITITITISLNHEKNYDRILARFHTENETKQSQIIWTCNNNGTLHPNPSKASLESSASPSVDVKKKRKIIETTASVQENKSKDTRG